MLLSSSFVLFLWIERQRKWKRQWAHPGTEPTWWVKTESCLQRHPYSGTADTDPLGQFFSVASLCLKAKGYIKVQIICTCMWLWESPTRPLGLCAVCLYDPPHRLTIYAADDSSPWSRARAQWRQASRAMATLLALHQNPGKISLGLRLGPPPIARKHLQDWDVLSKRCRHEVGSDIHERPFSQVGETGNRRQEWQRQGRMWQ